MAGVFRQIRHRLTLWYTAVLAITLVIFGIALYAGVRNQLLGPIDQNNIQSAQFIASAWSQDPDPSCGIHGPARPQSLLWECYTPNGQPLNRSEIAFVVPRFMDSPLLSQALHTGQASDIINSGTELHEISLYALRVNIPGDGAPLGVVEVGTPVGDRLRALNTLLQLLLVCGGGALAFASLGGLFLAGRSLVPARLAFDRQRDFIADASHELRTPLTMLRADAELLLRGRDALSPDQIEMLEDIVAESAHMTGLANSMLDLAQLDAGSTHIEREVVDLSVLVRDVAGRARANALARGVTVAVDAATSVLVVGDPLLLEHAVLILVDNAIKYNQPGGQVRLRTMITDGRAILQVQDTGIGIESQHLGQLGQRFYRVDKARSREAGGAGLGLSIARTIATRHGGTLELTSEPGQGTTVTVSLPAGK